MAPTRTPWIRHLKDDDDGDGGDDGDDGDDGEYGVAEPVTPPIRSETTDFFDDLAQRFHTIWMCFIWSFYIWTTSTHSSKLGGYPPPSNWSFPDKHQLWEYKHIPIPANP